MREWRSDNMDDLIYKSVVEEQPTGYLCIKIIFQEDDFPKDYEVVDVNRAYETITGTNGKKLIGKKLSQIENHAKKYHADWKSFFDEVVLHGGRGELDSFSEASQRWFRVHAYATSNNYIIAHVIDTSKEMFHFAQLEDFFNVNLDLLCIADVSGKFIKVNTAWGEILGYEKEELEGKTFLEFVHPEDIQLTLEAMERLNNQEQVTNFVNRYRSKSGKYKYIEWRSRPHGKIIYAAARDISKRIQMEKKLKEQTILLNELLNSIPDLISFKDTNGRYLGCNDEFSKFVGKKSKDIIHKTDFDLFNKKIAESMVESDRKMLQENDTKQYEDWVVYPDGMKKLIDTLKAPIRDKIIKQLVFWG